jgi:predicted adenylyl cyclase CyaB
MPSNIEIKAKVKDFARLQQVAATLSDAPVILLEQEDIFFHCHNGRLKLRIFTADRAELICYQRSDENGPKQSQYLITPTSDPAGLKATLTAALGVKGMVRKRRHLYLVGQTRIHLDQVESLGNFVELEFVLKPEQDPAEGIIITQELMAKLEIAPEDLITGAYLDLISNSPYN